MVQDLHFGKGRQYEAFPSNTTYYYSSQHGQRQSEENWKKQDQNYYSMKAYNLGDQF